MGWGGGGGRRGLHLCHLCATRPMLRTLPIIHISHLYLHSTHSTLAGASRRCQHRAGAAAQPGVSGGEGSARHRPCQREGSAGLHLAAAHRGARKGVKQCGYLAKDSSPVPSQRPISALLPRPAPPTSHLVHPLPRLLPPQTCWISCLPPLKLSQEPDVSPLASHPPHTLSGAGCRRASRYSGCRLFHCGHG